MQQTYTDTAGKQFIATVANNTLTMFVPRAPEVVRLKIPPLHRDRIRRAIRTPDFHSFAAAVDAVECI